MRLFELSTDTNTSSPVRAHRHISIDGLSMTGRRSSFAHSLLNSHFRLLILIVLILCIMIVVASGATAATAATSSIPDQKTPVIVTVVPNPVAENDVGEFIVVDTDGVSNLTLTDGESIITVPVVPGETVALSAAPNKTRQRVEIPVRQAAVGLSNGGEQLILNHQSERVHEVTYSDAPEGERLNATSMEWIPRGVELRSVTSTGSADVTAFVLPDTPAIPITAIQSANKRILLAGYTYASPPVTDALLSAADRGVRVQVLLEGSPVGGLSTAQRTQLNRLSNNGIVVQLLAGTPARFAYHHPKYAVIDNSAIVLSENWKPAGTGGKNSRGWGVHAHSRATASELASVFAHDSTGYDVIPWSQARTDIGFNEVLPATGQYPTQFDAELMSVDEIRVLTAPGNAGEAVRSRIDTAEKRIDVVSPRMNPSGPYFYALVDAAKRGIQVRLLLSDAWYDTDKNRAVVNRASELNATGLPIRAQIVTSGDQFGKIHAKGAIIDDRVALVGSLNWNEHAGTKNREVVLELVGDEPATYYSRVFISDWQGYEGTDTASRRGVNTESEPEYVPVLLALGALAAVIIAGYALYSTVLSDHP